MNSANQLIAGAIATLLIGCKISPQAAVTTTMTSVTVAELNDHVPVIGWLGKPLGTIVTISGRAVRSGERNDYWSVNMARNLFAVESVDGNRLKADIEIIMPRNVTFPKEGTVRFVGYEDGGFINPPGEAGEYDPELRMMQTNGRHFQTRFYALKVLP